MLKQPVLLIAVLAGTVTLLLRLRQTPRFAFLFRWVPLPFYAYFVPALLTAVGLLPGEHPVYSLVSTHVLPPCLAMLVMNADLPALRRLGRPAVGALVLGFIGITAGMVLSHALLARGLPGGAWAAAGALAASWTGGSANMIAVKQALVAPESAFAPIIVVDAFFAYAWMAFLIWAAGRRRAFDRWASARGQGDEPVSAAPPRGRVPLKWGWVPTAAVALGVGAVAFGKFAGPPLGALLAGVSKNIAAGFKPFTWTVLAVTTGGLALSLTGLFRAAPERTERLGNALLYFLLTTLGAQASLGALGRAPLFVALGAGALVTHALFLLAGARLFRWPLETVATASQACVGGVVSAPMVAAVYRPALAAVGLLLAVAGNVVGTYLGIATAQMCLFWGGQK